MKRQTSYREVEGCTTWVGFDVDLEAQVGTTSESRR